MVDARVDLIRRLAAESSELVESQLVAGEPVALVDFPYSTNPGDCAIWLGTRKMLKELGHDVRYLSDVGRYDADRLRVRHPSGPILIHGGGNLGDLWPEHQDLRLQVMRDFPDRLIVQMPQTIGFTKKGSQEEFAKALEVHGNMTLLVRDEASHAIALDMNARSFTCPDLAFQLGDLKRTKVQGDKILVLARTDHESNGLRDLAQHVTSSSYAGQISLEEWNMQLPSRLLWQMSRTPHRLLVKVGPSSRLRNPFESVSMSAYDATASVPLRAALNQIASSRLIITDRLHAHVIGLLLGIPQILVDNNYGKLSGIYNRYTQDSASSMWAENSNEAFDMIPHALSVGVR